MRVLITGVTGMAGSHLAEYVLANHPDATVFGTYRWRSKLDNLEELGRAGRLNPLQPNALASGDLAQFVQPGALNLVECDLLDPWSMRALINAVRPDRVFHLAAQSFVPASWSQPAQSMRVNVEGQINLFEAIRQADIDPLIHIAGSSEQYGLVQEDETPIKESNPLRPLSPYAVSKVTQELLAYQYHQSYRLRALTTRAFNHTGPRRGHLFVTSTFALQIAEIEAGLREPVIRVGDLTSKRDWTDVRDTVRGYWLALEYGSPGEVYNIGSGTTREVGEMLKLLLCLSNVEVEVRQDPSRMRPSDVKLLWADTTKFREATGWEPRIPFEQTMQDLLNYWRARVKGGQGWQQL